MSAVATSPVRDLPPELPERAAMACAVRSEKRQEVMKRRLQLVFEAYAAGLTDDAPAAWRNETIRNDLYRAEAADCRALAVLNLGAPGTPGEPVRWDDPRLGPLWPGGPPAWHAAAEAACRELEEKLRTPVPEPDEELTADMLAQLVEREWLRAEEAAGQLDRYRGGYVVAADRAILGHGKTLLAARRRAKKTAEKAGIPEGRWANYRVASS